jgi:acetyl esterase/lipase
MKIRFGIGAASILLLLVLVPFYIPALAQAPQASAQTKPLTVDSTIGELLDNPAARAVLQREVPVLVDSPQIDQAHDLSLRSIAVYAPTILTKERLQAINEALARTAGAVSSGKPRPQIAAPVADTRIALTLKTVPLWEGPAPGALGDKSVDIPTLTIVAPDGAVSFGTAVIVAPGGAYQNLASGMEGRQVADWFAAHGVTAFVLRYRLSPYGYHFPVQLEDSKRAIRWVRAHAGEFGVDPRRIGMIGFSAGGHLTAMTETLFDAGDPKVSDPIDRVSSRPDFAVLAYAPTEWNAEFQSDTSLVGPETSQALLRELSPVQNVSAQTPPTFIFQTTTDELVSPLNATKYYDALLAAKVPVEMHIFAAGRHGLGLGMTDPALSVWPSLLETWLNGIGMIGPKTVGQ